MGIVAHACNPSYSGGRDWEGQRSSQAQAISSQDPISTNAWVRWYTPVTPAMREV
jgi:hypothetical protein